MIVDIHAHYFPKTYLELLMRIGDGLLVVARALHGDALVVGAP